MIKPDKVTRRWIRSEADERAAYNGCRFNEARGQHVVDFFASYLTHGKQPHTGNPFTPLDWQRDELLMPLFGWERQDEAGRWVRRFQKTYIEIPKKNGKTSIAAGIGLYMLCADGWFDEYGDFQPETEAELYSIATSFGTAAQAHGIAEGMIQRSPELAEVLRVTHTQKYASNIDYEANRSFWRVLAASERSNQGQDAHLLICDELHEWYGTANYNALRYADSARLQALMFQITTAGDDPQSVCYQQYEYAKGVLDGTIEDGSFFPLIYEAAPDNDPLEEQTWRKANPSIGVTIRAEKVRQQADEAAKSPSSLDAFKRYRLNIWSTGESAWLRIADWHACKASWTPEDLHGQPCWAGLDLAKTRDTTSLQLVFRHEGRFRLLSYFWLPEETAREQNHLASWEAWSKGGFVMLTPGNVCDYAFVKKTIGELAATFDIREIAFDPWNAEHLTQEIEEELGVPRIAFGQTLTNFAGPTAEFERLILSREIEHCGQPVMDWQVGNVKVKPDANGNKRPMKPNEKDHRKVDGVVAAIMALARALQDEDPSYSIYDEPEDERVVFI